MSLEASPKILLVFCDGTGMDGSASDSTKSTNVLRLSRSVQPYSADGRRQIVFYQSGVGSETDFKGEEIAVVSIALKAFGVAVASKIRDAYVFIAQNYEEGDEICLFGFSRGAYTARKLSGLIDRIGLLETKDLGLFFSLWRELMEKRAPSTPAGTRRVDIKCVGVWDTVGSVQGTIDALSIQDTTLPATVEVALHALSLQENREKFLPTLWTPPASGLKEGQVLKQIWFPGAHSDVGGGFERHELADLALFWMAGETKSFINYDLKFLQSSAQRNPDEWGTSQPNNMYAGLSYHEAFVIGKKTRLENSDIKRTSIFHPSLQSAPTRLTKSDNMVTMDKIKSTFGQNWSPTYSELNAYEAERKTLWNTAGRSTTAVPQFDNVGDLFGPVDAPTLGV